MTRGALAGAAIAKYQLFDATEPVPAIAARSWLEMKETAEDDESFNEPVHHHMLHVRQ